MPLLTTSWDDGSRSDLELGTMLAARGVRATFYATTGPSGARAIADDDLAALVRMGHELGNHGRTHRLFTELDPDELRDEVLWGRAETARFGEPAAVVAPPKGRLDPGVISALEGWGAAVRAAPILGGRSDAVELMPTAQVFPHTRGRTLSHLVRRRLRPPLPALRAWFRYADLWDRLSALANEARRRDRDLHLWGHSEEIDRLGLWDHLDGLMGDLVAAGFKPVTNGELVRMRRSR